MAACLLIGCAMAELDLSDIKAKLDNKKKLLFDIKSKLEEQYKVFNGTTRNLGNCFGSGGLLGGKSLDGCGSELPAELSPTCDSKLGVTKACDCKGKKFVSKVAMKARSKDVDEHAELRAANVACFAAGDPMAQVFKEVAGKGDDNDHKLMYFGSVVSYSLISALCTSFPFSPLSNSLFFVPILLQRNVLLSCCCRPRGSLQVLPPCSRAR